MKIVLYDSTQGYLTPGGKTTHANKLYKELKLLGVDVHFSRWWDTSLKDCDLIHSLSYFDTSFINDAKAAGKKILLSHIMDVQTNKDKFNQFLNRHSYKIASKLPLFIRSRFAFDNFRKFDHFHYMHKFDRDTALNYFPWIAIKNTTIIPHAHDPEDMKASSDFKYSGIFPKKFLISCGNVSSRKQSSLLAHYANTAKIPIVFIGGANPSDGYFSDFIAEIDGINTFYLGYVDDSLKDFLLKSACGFVLLSKGESGCIAVYEAAAYNLPLLLSNLPWAWAYEDPVNINFCDFTIPDIAVSQLRDFYNNNNCKFIPPFRTRTWGEVAKMYISCYEEILK